MKTYIDMDGVLVDFNKRAFATWRDLPPPDEFGWFDIKDQHWQMIESDSKFWSDMEWQPGGMEVWAEVWEMDPWVLSAYNPAVMTSTIAGKIEWVEKKLKIPAWKAKFVMREDKQQFARHPSGTRNLLIDDSVKNCHEWAKAGGIAIYHKDIASTLAHLKDVRAQRIDLTISHLLEPQEPLVVRS